MKRVTFHDTSTVCWQKLKRDQYNDEPAPSDLVLDLGSAEVRPISRRLAQQIILKYEWLGTMASGANRFYGLFFGRYCAGATVFAPAGYNLPALAKTFKIPGGQLSYLGRGANVHWAPKGANSKLIAYSLKFEAGLGNKIAVAFADTDAGEIGTVYQATNWVYIGTGSTWVQWVSEDGKTWSFNQFTKWYHDHFPDRESAERFLLDHGWSKQNTNPKHRYVYQLDRSDRELGAIIRSLAQPYPKRGQGEIDSAPGPTGKVAAQVRPVRSQNDEGGDP